jgi:arabinogalactan oligomer/maltooligosaccharide transport system substrate-binding protein
MNRRIFWVMLILGVIASLVLGACAKPTEEATQAPVEEPTAVPTEKPTEVPTEVPAEPTEVPLIQLVVWADELRSPVINELGVEFATDYGVELVVQEMGFGDIRDQLGVAGPAGEGPDIIIGAHDWLGQLVVNGLVAPIDLGDKEDLFLDAAITAFIYEGQLYGMPYATENVAFFCNPDLVETAPATWDEVTTLAEQLEADSGGEVTAWTIQTNDPYHFFPVMSSFGGYVFGLTAEGYDPADVGLDSEGTIAAATWMQEMAAAGHLKPDVDYDVMHGLFEEGKVACIGTGPWALSRIRESGVNYTINPYPAGTAGSGRPFMGVQGFMISAFSENQLLALTILTEIFATDEFMQAIYEADPRPSALLSVRDATEDPDMAAFGVAGVDGLPMPAIPEMSSVWESWGNAEQLVISQQLDAQQAFMDAAEQVRTLLAE